MRSMVERGLHLAWLQLKLSRGLITPSTALRAVPLPVPGRI